jgi:hypothetical protein
MKIALAVAAAAAVLPRSPLAGEKATSSQDAQRQQQGQPTAAQQAQGAKPSAQTADQGC